jgi:hypothetical protein
LPAQAESAAASEARAALRSKVRRAIRPVLCRGARGIPAPVNVPHEYRWKIEGLARQVNELSWEFVLALAMTGLIAATRVPA